MQVQKSNIREVVLPSGSRQINRAAEEDTTYQYDAFGNLIQTTFADGTPCRDGNPIFSAYSPSRRRGVRIIQLEPAGDARELTFWVDDFARGDPEQVKELVVSCVLSEETLPVVNELLRQWVAGEEVRLPTHGLVPTSPFDPAAPKHTPQ